MSRRREVRRWHIGDRCLVHHTVRIPQRDGSHADADRWHHGQIVAVRGDRVVTREYNGTWEHEHPAYELRDIPREHPRFWPPQGHDTSKLRIRR